MNFLNLFRIVVGALLILSIAWKVSIPADNQTDLMRGLINFLERQQFDPVIVTEQTIDYMPLIRAERRGCHLQIARLTPDGSNRDLFQHFAKSGDRLFVVFDGRVYGRQPVSLTVISYLWSRFLRELRLKRHITPVIAVAASSGCNAESLPWEELRPAL